MDGCITPAAAAAVAIRAAAMIDSGKILIKITKKRKYSFTVKRYVLNDTLFYHI